MEFPDLNVIETLTYLLPGFVAAWVFYGLTAHPKKTPFERAVQALIFTAFIQPITIGLRELFFWIGTNPHYAWGTWTRDTFFAVSTVVGFLLGLVMSICANTNFPHRWLPSWVSKRTTAPSEWHSTFHKEQRWLYLSLKGGRRLYGWPFEWPDHPDCGHFVLVEPEWILDDNTRVPIYTAHRLLIPVGEVEMVEFEYWPNEYKHSAYIRKAAETVLVHLHSVSEEGYPPSDSVEQKQAINLLKQRQNASPIVPTPHISIAQNGSSPSKRRQSKSKRRGRK
ncbi:DUF6338 family protein [Planctomicrobium sp. SH527]|uniref:DUF6338 family protein n=1 Tax=Planctomicrobium sp. SH527 TaxID=3448123 RepID=UPI003F5C24B3